MNAQLQEAEKSGRIVLRCANLGFGYGSAPIVRGFTGTILRGDRIGILGPNGCGKTTLIRLLLGELAPQEGSVTPGTRLEVAHDEQLHDVLDDARTVMETISEGRDMISVGSGERHVVGYLRDFLFTTEQIQAPVLELSGGERKRLQLARILSRPCNLLVLDEPTNDLDLETLDLLEDMLLEFRGTLLVVSHDRAFLDNVVTSTLVFEGDGRWREYVGGYSDWVRQKQSDAPDAPARAPKPKAVRATSGARRGEAAGPSFGFKEKRELASLPDVIQQLESKRQSLFDLLGSPAFYAERGDEVVEMRQQLATVEAEIQSRYARWIELETLAAPDRT